MRRRNQPIVTALFSAALILAGAPARHAIADAGVERAPDRARGQLIQESGGDGCVELAAVFEAQNRLYAASLNNDADAAAAVLGELPTLADSAVDAAPGEIAGAVGAWVRPWQPGGVELVGLDLTDAQTLFALISRTNEFEAATEAVPVVVEHLDQMCHYTVDDAYLVPDPPAPCEELDAIAASAAAGMPIDPSVDPGSLTRDGIGLSWDLCTYDNGDVSLYSMSFNSLGVAAQLLVEGTLDWGGDIVDADVATLPDSTFVTRLMGAVTVVVLDAPTPFAVQLAGGEISPADAVRAAEALFGTQNTSLSSPPPSAPPTT